MKERLNTRASALFARLGYSDHEARDAKREAWWWLTARRGVLRGRRVRRGHAIVWTHPGRCELLPVDVPGPSPREVTVAVESSVVSTGTERAAYAAAGTSRVKLPFRPGYSAAGTVVAAGRKASVSSGDRVAVIAPHASLVTIDDTSAFPIPDALTTEHAAFVQLGVIARHGVEVAAILPGERVCVFGLGVIGTLALRLCAAAGADDLIAVARTDRRADLARRVGAQFVASSAGADLSAIEADVVIDSTGDAAAFRDAVSAVRPGGRVVLLGSPRGVTRDVPVAELRARAITVLGAHISMLSRGRDAVPGSGARHATAFLDQLTARAVEVDDLVDLDLDPRQAPAFYRNLPTNQEVTVARFDWTLLDTPAHKRLRSLRPPDLAARGVAFHARPLSVSSPLAEELGGDPLANPEGGLRFALVGCGDIGEQNAAALAAAPNTRLVACFDPQPELTAELASRFGATPAGSFDALLADDDVEAVLVAVPHDLHAPLTAAVAASGRHVIVEKPLAESLEAAVAAADAVRAAGVTASVLFPQRYDASVRAAGRLVRDGALGELRGTLTTFLADKPPSYWQGGYSGRSLSDWRASKLRAGGGVLIMNLSHHIDVVLQLARVPVESVTAFVSPEERSPEVESSVAISIEYANGAVGTLFASSAVPGAWEGRQSTDIRVWGTSGHVAVEPEGRVYTLAGTTGLSGARWHDLDRVPTEPLRTVFVSRFATAVARGEQPDVTLDEALAVQAFIEAAYVSAERGGVAVRPRDLLAAAAAPVGVGAPV